MDLEFFTGELGDIVTMNLPDIHLFNYYRDMKSRTIWLDEEVTEQTTDIIRKIIHWNRQDAGKPIEERVPIKLFLFSNGGDLDVCNAVIDTIQSSETPVWGINVGKAYSSACYIYVCCDKRFCMKRAQFILHKGSVGLQGNYSEFSAAVEAYQQQIEDLMGYLLETTNLTREDIEKKMQSDWYIDADQSVEYGMTDVMISSLDEVM